MEWMMIKNKLYVQYVHDHIYGLLVETLFAAKMSPVPFDWPSTISLPIAHCQCSESNFVKPLKNTQRGAVSHWRFNLQQLGAYRLSLVTAWAVADRSISCDGFFAIFNDEIRCSRYPKCTNNNLLRYTKANISCCQLIICSSNPKIWVARVRVDRLWRSTQRVHVVFYVRYLFTPLERTPSH